jgi:hypothetical protein
MGERGEETTVNENIFRKIKQMNKFLDVDVTVLVIML